MTRRKRPGRHSKQFKGRGTNDYRRTHKLPDLRNQYYLSHWYNLDGPVLLERKKKKTGSVVNGFLGKSEDFWDGIIWGTVLGVVIMAVMIATIGNCGG